MSERAAEVRGLPKGFGAGGGGEGEGGGEGKLEDLLARADEQAAYSEIRRALATGVRDTRRSRQVSQQEVADLIGSSQPRVSMMEAGDVSVSLNLMIRTLLRLGARRTDVAHILSA